MLRLLADGKVAMGTSSVQKDTMQAWPVALVQREEHDEYETVLH